MIPKILNLHNDVSIFQGQVEKKFMIEDKKRKLGGVLVSENGNIAIASEKRFVQPYHAPPVNGIAKLWVIDLKVHNYKLHISWYL